MDLIKSKNQIKIKNLCSPSDLVKILKIQSTDWENIFTNHVYEKELVSRMHKELSKTQHSNHYKKKLNSKRCPTSFAIMEMQIKAMSITRHWSKWLSKKLAIPSVGEDVEKLD